MTTMLLHRVLLSALGRTSVLAAVTVMICAFFVARMVSSLVAAEVLTEDPGGRAPPPVKRIEPPRAKLDGTKIARNIFCSTCVPAEPGPDPGGRYTGEPAVLIATMIGRESRATVRVLATEAQGSWGLGERIPGVGTIDRIGSSSIDVVDVAGHRGTLSLLDASAAQPPPERGAATPRPAPSHPFADRIRKVADGDYEVDRQLVRELVTGSTKAGGVRPVPYMKGGEVHGLRLLGVRSNSVAGALALRNGDIIAAINGEPIRNIQQLLDLYAKLDQLSAVELTGTRAGKPLALTLRLR